jgi:peroxiredoxin
MLKQMLPLVIVVLLVSCGQQAQTPAYRPPAKSSGYGHGYDPPADHRLVHFNDTAETNTPTDVAIKELRFSDVDGKPVELKRHLGEKNLLLVITRGYTSRGICFYCSTHTSRLVNNYEKFKERNAEVVVVFPVEQGDNKQQLDEFLKATREKLDTQDAPVPFPVLLDLKLENVAKLDIKEDLSRPATYILDKKGKVQFAHLGSDVDRPSIKALLEKLDTLK